MKHNIAALNESEYNKFQSNDVQNGYQPPLQIFTKNKII